MYGWIYKNSFIMTILFFILICVIFFVLRIGYTVEITDKTLSEKFNFSIPVALTLLFFIVYHYFVLPHYDITKKNTTNKKPHQPNAPVNCISPIGSMNYCHDNKYKKNNGGISGTENTHSGGIYNQYINMKTLI
jgi:hypothetical protein